MTVGSLARNVGTSARPAVPLAPRFPTILTTTGSHSAQKTVFLLAPCHYQRAAPPSKALTDCPGVVYTVKRGLSLSLSPPVEIVVCSVRERANVFHVARRLVVVNHRSFSTEPIRFRLDLALR